MLRAIYLHIILSQNVYEANWLIDFEFYAHVRYVTETFYFFFDWRLSNPITAFTADTIDLRRVR